MRKIILIIILIVLYIIISRFDVYSQSDRNKRIALIIGISDYSKLDALRFPKNDAEDFYNLLISVKNQELLPDRKKVIH